MKTQQVDDDKIDISRQKNQISCEWLIERIQ